jgi:hypothetical protein
MTEKNKAKPPLGQPAPKGTTVFWPKHVVPFKIGTAISGSVKKKLVPYATERACAIRSSGVGQRHKQHTRIPTPDLRVTEAMAVLLTLSYNGV